jgi:hypothetical protein
MVQVPLMARAGRSQRRRKHQWECPICVGEADTPRPRRMRLVSTLLSFVESGFGQIAESPVHGGEPMTRFDPCGPSEADDWQLLRRA